MTKLTLLCLPYSGASAMVYSRWRRKLPEWLHLQQSEKLAHAGSRSGPKTGVAATPWGMRKEMLGFLQKSPT